MSLIDFIEWHGDEILLGAALTLVVGGLGTIIYLGMKAGAEREKIAKNTHISRQIEFKEGHSKENILENILLERTAKDETETKPPRGINNQEQDSIKNYVEIGGAKFKKEITTLPSAYLLTAPTRVLPMDSGDEGYGYEYQEPVYDVGGKHLPLVTKIFTPMVAGTSYEVKVRELLENEELTTEQFYKGFIEYNEEIFLNRSPNLEFSIPLKKVRGVIESIERTKSGLNYEKK